MEPFFYMPHPTKAKRKFLILFSCLFSRKKINYAISSTLNLLHSNSILYMQLWNLNTINIQCTNNLYDKFQDPNKIPSTPLIFNLWIKKDWLQVVLPTHWSNINDKSCQTNVIFGHFIVHMKNLYDYAGQIIIVFEHFIIHMENHTMYNLHVFTITSI